MNDLIIYPRFQKLMPPLMGIEVEHLEANILEEGIRDSILIWRNKIVDGHNRYEIAKKYGLSYKVVEMPFADEDEACEWIITNQLGRRNLEPHIKTLFIGQLHELRKKRVGNPQLTETPVNSNSVTVSELGTSHSTAQKIAEEVGVSPRTVERAAKVYDSYQKADPVTKKQFDRGEISQKKLVAPKPTVNEILDTDESDEVTRMCRDYGNRFQDIIRKFEALQDEASVAFEVHKLRFIEFAHSLAIADFKSAKADANLLRRFIKCPICNAAQCKQCKTGYIRDDQKDQVLDQAEYAARGGYTVDV